MDISRIVGWFGGQIVLGKRGEMSRAIFKEPGAQARFLREVKKQLGLTLWKEMAQLCGVDKTTIHGWLHEKRNMSAEAVQLLCERSGVTSPSYEVISDEERRRRAGSKGGKKSHKLYGNPATLEDCRKGGKKCYELYGNPATPEGCRKGGRIGGRRISQLRRMCPDIYPLTWKKEILTPSREDPLQAELACILLGDGHIGDREVYVDLHGTEEVEYAEVVAQLFKKLFNLKATVKFRSDSDCCRVIVYSVALVEHLERIGLHRGSKVKQQVGVPAWIRLGENSLLVAGVRGLMDTDGGPILYTDKRLPRLRHSVRLNFSNSSTPLLNGMWEMLSKLGYHPARSVGYVQLGRKEEAQRYYREIGTRNAYHMREYIRKAGKAWNKDASEDIKFLG